MSKFPSWDRLGALSGILFVVITVAAIAIGSAPMDLQPEQSAALLARELAENRDASQAGMRLLLVAVFFLFWFLAFLRDHLAAAEQEKGWASSVAFAAGLAAATLLLVGASAGFAETVDVGVDPVVTKTFFVYGWEYFNVLGPPFAALVVAATVTGFRFAAFPRWFCWTSLAFSALLVFLMGTVPGMGMMIAVVWIMLASAVLLFWGRTAT